jgi:hypothetical protein
MTVKSTFGNSSSALLGDAVERNCLSVPRQYHGILEQLLMGATDITASRNLNVSPRTFSRRVAELQDYLQVETRFQCGVQVAFLNWVSCTREGGWTLTVPGSLRISRREI